MTDRNLKTKFLSNLSYAFVTQFLAMSISVVINLILPKFIGTKDYSYWQLFIFYSQYIPFFHLGLNDGVYLRYGGTSLEKLNNGRVKSQLCIGLIYQIGLCILLYLTSYVLVHDSVRVSIILFACVYFIFYTIQNYMGYIFQAANETAWYSKSIMLNRLLFVGMMLGLFVFGSHTFWPYVTIYIIAQFVTMVYSLLKGKTIINSEFIGVKETFKELKVSISAGSKLMLANIASMLILGSGRQLIDMKWGLLTFGKISFAITLTNFVLTFIQQIGMVMFPMLHQVKEETQKSIFDMCRKGLFLILPVIFICYFPGKMILSVWLPEYEISLKYLALLLPICFFDTKMQMVYNTYLKVFRKEKVLFSINLVALAISFGAGIVGVYVLENLQFVLISMVLAIAVRSIIGEIYLSKLMDVKSGKYVFQEAIIVIIFMVCAWNLNNLLALGIMSCVYAVYLALNQKLVKDMMLIIKQR